MCICFAWDVVVFNCLHRHGLEAKTCIWSRSALVGISFVVLTRADGPSSFPLLTFGPKTIGTEDLISCPCPNPTRLNHIPSLVNLASLAFLLMNTWSESALVGISSLVALSQWLYVDIYVMAMPWWNRYTFPLSTINSKRHNFRHLPHKLRLFVSMQQNRVNSVQNYFV